MKIALIGYGKMGKEIEKIAKKRGHSISSIIDQNNTKDFTSDDFLNSDVAIEFSRPESAVSNYKSCFKNNIPVVSGTTGWLEQFDEISSLCKENNQAFFYASNFSLGVNIFFEINKKLAKLIDTIDGYDVSINEIHHIQKLDAPSGTAISIAEQIIDHLNHKKSWALDSNIKSKINITAQRIADTPGTHTVKYESEIDEITIEHKAKNRKGFALGAVLAAEYLKNRKGIFNMQDLLNL